MTRQIGRWLPILDWARVCSRTTLASDLLAAVIVTIMPIPQSLAYALLAGLPPEAGLHASIVPIFPYTILGTSGVPALGPLAVVSLMTAATIGQLSEVKGPVMDRLRRSALLDHRTGSVVVSQFEAFCKLTGRCTSQPLGPHAKH